MRSNPVNKIIEQELRDWGYYDDEMVGGMHVEDPLGEAVSRLRIAGVEIKIDPYTPEGVVLIAEAVNLAAKVLDDSFYELKPDVWSVAAGWPGVTSGWADDGTFALYHPEAGTVHAHDPMGQIKAKGKWPHPWSGLCRQGSAIRALADDGVRRTVAFLTQPGNEHHVTNLFDGPLAGPVGTIP